MVGYVLLEKKKRKNRISNLLNTHTCSALIGLRCPQYDICYAEWYIVFNVQSFSDGPENSGSGNFFYVWILDTSMQDVKENATVSFTLSEEMIGNRCSNSFIDGHDAEDPRCVRLVMTGTWRLI